MLGLILLVFSFVLATLAACGVRYWPVSTPYWPNLKTAVAYFAFGRDVSVRIKSNAARGQGNSLTKILI